ncbi:MAG: FlgD immunoglobulin-like domain containing protein [bacterium]
MKVVRQSFLIALLYIRLIQILLILTLQILYEVFDQNVIEISIFDISGDHVNTLINELKPPGKYSFSWNGEDSNNQIVPSGLYYCVVTASGFRDAQKIILLK